MHAPTFVRGGGGGNGNGNQAASQSAAANGSWVTNDTSAAVAAALRASAARRSPSSVGAGTPGSATRAGPERPAAARDRMSLPGFGLFDNGERDSADNTRQPDSALDERISIPTTTTTATPGTGSQPDPMTSATHSHVSALANMLADPSLCRENRVTLTRAITALVMATQQQQRPGFGYGSGASSLVTKAPTMVTSKTQTAVG